MIEEKEDFFEKTPQEEPAKEKEPKKPVYKPDDPRYYDQEEGKWDHLTPAPYRRGPILWIVGFVIVACCLLIGMYVYLFSPQVSEAAEYGYVDRIQKEGKMFPSFEGVLLPYKNIMDTLQPYEGDFAFSTTNDSVATSLLRRQGTGNPVKIVYKVYRFKMPWRGNTRVIVTGVDTNVNPANLLPPDRRPPLYRQPAPEEQP